jgi:heme exporter protein C
MPLLAVLQEIDMLKQLHKKWWKILCVVLLVYTFSFGLLVEVPTLPVLYETIRNLFFHVSCWFAMLLLFFVSLWNGIVYLRKGRFYNDIVAAETARVGLVFGCLGFITGMLWGNFTWGNLSSWLTQDYKILGAFIGLLIYFAYFVLRGSIDDEEKRAKVSAVYSVCAFVLLNVFIMVLPRLKDSLHPGNGGNSSFTVYDLDSTLRAVFYPAVLAYFLVGFWISTLLIRMKFLHYKINNISIND